MIATTLRVLNIERNNISDMGIATLSKHLDVSKCLVSLSLKHNNIGVGGAAHIAKALSFNIHLRYLSLAGNPLENYGVAQLAKALKSNKCLETLDMSDVYFTDEACLALNDGLLLNRSLRSLIMSNTFVSKTPSSLLINTFKNSKAMKVLRWGNLKYFAEAVTEYSAGKVLCTEYLKYPIALITPYIGDLHVSLLNDICKFQVPIIYQQTQLLYTDQGRSSPTNLEGASQRDGNKVDEKQVQRNYFKTQEMMRTYFTFIVHYWQTLKNGDVALILKRPSKSPTSVMPYNQESDLLKDLIGKSDYKTILPKYTAMTPADYLEHFNKRDDSFMEIKFQSVAKGFVNKQGINDQYLFDNEYIVNEEECFKLRGCDTRLLNYEIMEQLFDYGFDPFVEDKDGIDAYMEAIMEGDIEILEHLMAKGGSLNKIYSGSQNIQDFCVFHFAVLSNRIEMLQYILDSKHKLGISIDLNYKNRQGDTAGQLASRLTKFEFAKLIFEYGGITELPLIKNLDSNGVYERYYKNNNNFDGPVPDIVQEFDDLGEEKMEYPPLIEAIIKNDEDKFLKLINSKVDINQRDPNGMAPIHHALFLEREHLAAYLLERGCSVNLKDKSNMTPLHVAVIKSSPQLVATLIKHGADVDSVNLDGNTPLHLAAKRRRANVVKILLDEKAEPYLFNLIHKTAAQMTDDQEIRDLIRKAGNKKKIIMTGAEKIAYGKN